MESNPEIPCEEGREAGDDAQQVFYIKLAVAIAIARKRRGMVTNLEHWQKKVCDLTARHELKS